MMSKREKAIYYATQQTKNGSIYLWGGQGEKLADLTDQDIYDKETSKANAETVFNFIGKEYLDKKIKRKKAKAFDCSGLVIMALIYAGVLRAGYDATADTLLHKFPEPVAALPGDIVFKVDATGHAYHTGILKDLSTVIEAKGRAFGIVESSYNSQWNAIRSPY